MQKKSVNSQYNVAEPTSLPVRIASYQRKRMYQRFLETCHVEAGHTLLDIGVTSDQSYEASNYLEAWYPHKDKITAVGIDDARFLEDIYPGMKFVQANGLDLPFDDKSFDFVHSSAVLEHVGNAQNQVQFISECCRVARKGIFLTTPNRWFPVEFHTVLPLIHWLPKPIFRGLLKKIGYGFFADEKNLNLMTPADVKNHARQVSGFDFSVTTVPLMGYPSNILLSGQRSHDPVA